MSSSKDLYYFFRKKYKCACENMPYEEIVSIMTINVMPIDYAYGDTNASMVTAIVQIRILRKNFEDLETVVKDIIHTLDGKKIKINNTNYNFFVDNLAYPNFISIEKGIFRYGIITLTIKY